MRIVRTIAITLALLAVGRVTAQQSPNYKADEYVFNAAGVPVDGASLISPNFSVTVGSLGEGAVGIGLGSTSFGASLSTGAVKGDAGFGSFNPPPGEATGLTFGDKTTLGWSPEKSVGTYDLYAGDLVDLPGLGFGSCRQNGLTGETAVEPAIPVAGHGTFYLVTAKNTLGEEGTKGTKSDGTERANGAPCP